MAGVGIVQTAGSGTSELTTHVPGESALPANAVAAKFQPLPKAVDWSKGPGQQV